MWLLIHLELYFDVLGINRLDILKKELGAATDWEKEPSPHASEKVGQDFLVVIFPNRGSKLRWGCKIKGRKTANLSMLGLKNNSPYRQKPQHMKLTRLGFKRTQTDRFPLSKHALFG